LGQQVKEQRNTLEVFFLPTIATIIQDFAGWIVDLQRVNKIQNKKIYNSFETFRCLVLPFWCFVLSNFAGETLKHEAQKIVLRTFFPKNRISQVGFSGWFKTATGPGNNVLGHTRFLKLSSGLVTTSMYLPFWTLCTFSSAKTSSFLKFFF